MSGANCADEPSPFVLTIKVVSGNSSNNNSNGRDGDGVPDSSDSTPGRSQSSQSTKDTKNGNGPSVADPQGPRVIRC